MRFASSSEILSYIREHPDCVTSEIVSEFYQEGTYLPCDIISGRDNIIAKLAVMKKGRTIINTNPGKGRIAVWRVSA